MKYILIYLCAINVITFLMYGVDKRKAKKNKFRISERTLIMGAVLGGCIGAFLGMRVFHHKTQKAKFYIGIPAIFLLQVAAVLYFLFK